MPTSPGSLDYGRVDELAEEFAARFRRGERPALEEYTDLYLELAEEIRELFPAMVKALVRLKESLAALPGEISEEGS